MMGDNPQLRAVLWGGITGLIIAYAGLTVMSWDVDTANSYYSRESLVHWIYVNQILHVWRMLHYIF